MTQVFHSHDVKFNKSEKENEMNNNPIYHIELNFSHKGENMTDSENCSAEQSSIEYEGESVPLNSESYICTYVYHLVITTIVKFPRIVQITWSNQIIYSLRQIWMMKIIVT